MNRWLYWPESEVVVHTRSGAQEKLGSTPAYSTTHYILDPPFKPFYIFEYRSLKERFL